MFGGVCVWVCVFVWVGVCMCISACVCEPVCVCHNSVDLRLLKNTHTEHAMLICVGPLCNITKQLDLAIAHVLSS